MADLVFGNGGGRADEPPEVDPNDPYEDLTVEQQRRLANGEDPRVVLDPAQYSAYIGKNTSRNLPPSEEKKGTDGNIFGNGLTKPLEGPVDSILKAVGLREAEDNGVAGYYNTAGQWVSKEYAQGLIDDEVERRATGDAYKRAATREAEDPDIKAQDQVDPGSRTVTEIKRGSRVGQRDVEDIERVDAPGVEGPGSVTFGMKHRDINAPDLGNAAQASGISVADTKIDGNALALRGDRIKAAESARDAPGSAAAAFRAAMLASQEAQAGMAAQARGAERAGARREAMLGIGRDSLQAAEKTAELDAREKQAAAKNYSDALSGISGDDVDVAKTQAQLDARKNETQANIIANTEEANAGRRQLRQSEVGKYRFDADKSNRDFEFDIEGKKSDIAGQNIERTQLFREKGADRSLTASTANAGQENLRRSGNATRGVQVDTSNAQLDADEAAANATAYNTADADNIRTRSEVGRGNADRRLTGDTARDASRLARTNAMVSAAQGMGARQGRAGQAIDRQIQVSQGRAGGAIDNADRKDKGRERLVKLITTGGAIAMSDERVKSDIKPAGKSELAELASAFKAATFRYKPGIEDGGQDLHAGTMAQDIEKTKLGKGLVSKDDNGIRHLDRAGLAMMLAAAAAKSTRARG